MSDAKDIAFSALGVHEALHTAHVVICMFDEHVADHPAVAERADIAALAHKAVRAMADVYQALGRIEL